MPFFTLALTYFALASEDYISPSYLDHLDNSYPISKRNSLFFKALNAEKRKVFMLTFVKRRRDTSTTAFSIMTLGVTDLILPLGMYVNFRLS
jgi:hypothetical protein